MNIVLHEPEIPHNTGAIGRTCLMTGAGLHLIRPMGFFLDEKSLKRAGMDYWPQINVREYNDFGHFMEANPGIRFHLVETGGVKTYAKADYKPGDFLVFGSESKGLPTWLLKEYSSQIVSIPMAGSERSLNLSVSAGIVLYEALRQNNFNGLV